MDEEMGIKPCITTCLIISTEELFINRVSCPYHKCLTGRGVCFMATRAPPQSRNQTLYSSSKIWNNNNNNDHSNTLHLHGAWKFTKFFTYCFSSRFWAFQQSYIKKFDKRGHPHLIDEKNGLWRTNNCQLSLITQMALPGFFPLVLWVSVPQEIQATRPMLN